MTLEEKKLVIKDICGRLPYEVKCEVYDRIGILDEISSYGAAVNYSNGEDTTCRIEYVKPYLFPLSSMTEEQKEEYYGTFSLSGDISGTVDFYNKHHLDWRGLIPMGLAIDCTNLNIY